MFMAFMSYLDYNPIMFMAFMAVTRKVLGSTLISDMALRAPQFPRFINDKFQQNVSLHLISNAVLPPILRKHVRHLEGTSPWSKPVA